MKAERKNQKQQEKKNTNVIQKKEGKSFVKPKGDTNSFSPPTTSGKQNKSLPAKLQSNMESSLGQDFSNVGIYTNSQKAVQMQARAFTQSEQVHFAPGEFNPGSTSGKNLIGHEFTHIAQQRAGVVKPTKAMKKGVLINDDRSLESEADNFGRKAARGEAISKYRSSGLGIRSSLRTAQTKSNVVQMVAIPTFGGSWDTDEYKTVQDEANGVVYGAAVGVRGANIKLKFTPDADADAELIGITQTANSVVKGSPTAINATVGGRSIPSNDADVINGRSEEGVHIDRASAYNNPIYPVQSQPSASLDDTNLYAGWGQHGYRKKVGNAWAPPKDATLIDSPRLDGAAKNSEQIFESTALAVKGNQEGTYYGSVQWGWKTDAAGTHTLIPFKKISDGVPSGTFMKAAKLWNDSKDSTGADTVDLPLQWSGTIHNTPLAALRTGRSVNSQILADLPRNTTLTVLNDSSNWLHVQVDKTQAGIILNRHGRAAVMTGNIIRGYVSQELVNKDASYR